MSTENQTVVVMHAHQIWKNACFTSIAQAFEVVRKCNPRLTFKLDGEKTMYCLENKEVYKAKVLESFQSLSQLLGERIV